MGEIAKKESGLRQWLRQPTVVSDMDNALGGWMKGDDFIAQILIAMSTPEISRCSEASKFRAAHVCAALGLLPTVNHVALIPRNQNGTTEVTVMPQWQGWKSLMERNAEVKEVSATLVHKNDTLAYNTVTRQIADHAYDPLDPARTFNKLEDIKGGYLRITYTDGRPDKLHFTTAAQIDKARKCAQTRKVWDAWFEQMALKTIYRDAYARRAVPIDPLVANRLQATQEQDDEVLGNDPSRVTTAGQDLLPAANPVDRNQAILDVLGTNNAEVEVQQEPPEPEPPKKKTRKKKEPLGPPPIPDHLVDEASLIHESYSPDDLSDMWKQISARNNETFEDHKALEALMIWKSQQFGGAGKSQGTFELGG